MKRLTVFLFFITFCVSCSGLARLKTVSEAKGKIPATAKIEISDPERFLNDLMLSPYWKVEKDRDGDFIAKARSIGEDWPFDREGLFLFEFMMNPDRKFSDTDKIFNKYLRGNKRFSSFKISVVFKHLNHNRITPGLPGENISIPVYESYGAKIGPNSSSELAIKLSSQHEIYLLLYEQGSDPERKTTLAKIAPAINELRKIAQSPKSYSVEDRYDDFFKLFFSSDFSESSGEMKRFPGMQGRDTFFGYLRTKAETSYGGVNIKISHPVYCPEEGTRNYSRLRKAEYLGIPYSKGDILFFLIEDNAVYLSGEYDERFGFFSGEESFEGELELLNDKNEVLLKSKGQFTGWQR